MPDLHLCCLSPITLRFLLSWFFFFRNSRTAHLKCRLFTMQNDQNYSFFLIFLWRKLFLPSFKHLTWGFVLDMAGSFPCALSLVYCALRSSFKTYLMLFLYWKFLYVFCSSVYTWVNLGDIREYPKLEGTHRYHGSANPWLHSGPPVCLRWNHHACGFKDEIVPSSSTT